MQGKSKSRPKRVKKVILIIVISVFALTLLFVGIVFLVHTIRSDQELNLLKERGYYDPVSVGEYELNAARFGNADGKHTIVCMAGLGMGDFSVSARRMTACLEEDNLVVFVDRAGYGLSGDTKSEMTLEYIVEDYRKALKNAGIEAPYILLPHSIGGAYATWWVSKYPEEIEAVVFVDGSQISSDAFDDEDIRPAGFYDRLLAALAKLGFSRFVLREYFYLLPDDFSEEEQYLADALDILTMDSVATVSESALIAQNAQRAFNEIVTNDVPKLYISSSWGFDNVDDLNEHGRWINRQIEKNGLDMPLREDLTDEDSIKEILDTYEEARRDTLFPYLEKMGNCQYAALGGDHCIYLQKPAECGQIIKDFIDGLEHN